MVPSRSRTFADWAEHHNLRAVRASVTVSSWVWTGLLGGVVVFLAGKFFAMHTTPACVVLAVVCSVSIAGALATSKSRPSARGVGTIVGNTLTMWFVASLVTLSNERGATVFALLPVLVGAYHGYLLRMGTRFPFGIVSTAFGVSGALALDTSHVALFALIVPLAIGVSLTLGNVALRTDALNAEADRLREAIAAQALQQKNHEAQQLSTALLDVLGRNHDIGNSLAAARLNVDWLERETKRATEDVHSAAKELHGNILRIVRIFEESRRIGAAMGPVAALHEVNVAGSLARARDAVAQRFDTPVHVTAAAEVHVLVRGGATNLERVLENLLLNACEGNGERGASEIIVRAAEGPEGFVTIEVLDDGPGFPPERLRETIGAFTTTKHEGTGLGLYTAERLIVASGGELVRANRPGRGALVRITLARGDTP